MAGVQHKPRHDYYDHALISDTNQRWRSGVLLPALKHTLKPFLRSLHEMWYVVLYYPCSLLYIVRLIYLYAFKT